MTSEQARKFIEAHGGARSYVKPSHLEELSQLLEVHVEAVETRKDEFHELDGGKTYMPRKETIDRFAQAAGVSYNGANETTRLESDGVYVGRAQAMVLGPDGKWILGPTCEYGFEIDVRLEEMRLNQKYDYDLKKKRDYTELELQKERIQLLKVGRQRANTGARSRATLAMLGMQTGFKGLFQKNDPEAKTVTFLFSRIIVNAKNELVMNRMLDGIAGPQAALYGPAPARAIAAPAEAEPRNVTEPEGGFADVPFDEPDPVPAVDERVETLIGQLGDWTRVENKPVANIAQRVLDSGETRVNVLELALPLLSYLASGNPRGAKQVADALAMLPLDPVILADLVKKTGGAKEAAA